MAELGFFLKKAVSFFLMPMSIGFVLLAIGIFFLFRGKIKYSRYFVTASFIWLFLVSHPLVSNALLNPLESKYPKFQKTDKDLKYVVVLGNGMRCSERFPVSSQLEKTSLARINEGIVVYREFKDAKLILSGYDGGREKYSCAVMYSKMAFVLGVPKEDMIIEERAKDTHDEAVLIKDIVQNAPFALVTSANHMPRAVGLFKKVGLNPVPAPTDFLVRHEGSLLDLPHPGTMANTRFAFHEYLGLLWGKLRGKI